MIKLASSIAIIEYINGNFYKFNNSFAWILVHYHNSTRGDYYNKNNNEVLNCKSKYKFSILGKLNEYKMNNGFEFLLEYPELSGYNHWYQSSNPAVSSTVEDYRNINISWNSSSWFGLAKSSDSANTLIDGSPFNWHYPIGVYRDWIENSSSIPGPYSCNAGYQCLFHEVFLWVRISNEKIQKIRERVCTKKSSYSFNHLFFVNLFFVSYKAFVT